MSSGKTLSNSTLSLRFMQNAQRAKQQAAVDLESAKVKDEAEWEVPKQVTATWGLASGSKAKTGQTIVQESSYLPFLFPSLQNGGSSSNDEAADKVTTSTKISGRRSFAKGREIAPTASSGDGPADGDADSNIKKEHDAALLKPIGSAAESKKPRFAGGPLTGKRTAARLAELDNGTGGGLPIGETPASDIPVLAMISEETSAAVGMDLRQIRRLKGKGKEKEKVFDTVDDETKPALQSLPDTGKSVNSSNIGKGPLSFLRPTGVDSPAPSSGVGKKSRKREHEFDAEAEAGEASPKSAWKKADSESPSIDGAYDTRNQATKKKKKRKQIKTESESGLYTPAS
ncbi:hypothetical protein ACEPAI_2291 [Sanghuangporus weigelae]